MEKLLTGVEEEVGRQCLFRRERGDKEDWAKIDNLEGDASQGNRGGEEEGGYAYVPSTR